MCLQPPQAALDSSPGIPQLGKWLGLTDPTQKSALFFKLHQLQVGGPRHPRTPPLPPAPPQPPRPHATARVATAPTRQVLSWGTSTVGRIGQRIDFEEGLLESSFDTIIFGLTVVPLLGWGKLLPTFGGRVLTEADGLKLEGDEIVMELQRTKVISSPRGRP